MGTEDWESVFSGSSPSREHSIFKLIMDDISESSVGFNKMLIGSDQALEDEDEEFNTVAGFGVVEQSFGFDSVPGTTTIDTNILASFGFPFDIQNQTGDGSRLISVSNPNHQNFEDLEGKPEILNPQVDINRNPGLFLPVSYETYPYTAVPPSKRLNSVQPDFRPDSYNRVQTAQDRRQFRPNYATVKQRMADHDQLATEQAIIDMLFKAAELIGSGSGSGNVVHAQEILARLNHHHHQLSGDNSKAFDRAAFYFKEALELILQNNGYFSPPDLSNYSLVFKISAYKSFSEISPVLRFANFTCNQALLETIQGFDRIHIIDFDIGYGGQWASLMQELVFRNGGPPSCLKITAFASSHDGLEVGFTRENLINFAREVNISLEIEILSLESLSSVSIPHGAVAVNLPISCFSSHPSSIPLILRLVKLVSPKIVVSLERGCDRTDVPFPHHVIHSLRCYSSLLESLDEFNMNPDNLEKIERFLFQPEIEKVVANRHRCFDRTPPWRNLFVQCGLSPLMFSNFAESQAEFLVQRCSVRGFHVEKRQSSLVLCWHRKELISASAWRCSS